MSSDNSFIHNDFLLESDNARLLYHDYVKKLPIIDYHNHLSPKLICENTIFDSITSQPTTFRFEQQSPKS